MKFPATTIVHTTTGPMPCCDKHAKKLEALMSFMGGRTNNTDLLKPTECINCLNEAMKL